MSESKKSEKAVAPIEESYQPPSGDRSHAPCSTQPSGQRPNFTPPPDGSGAPSKPAAPEPSPSNSSESSGNDT